MTGRSKIIFIKKDLPLSCKGTASLNVPRMSGDGAEGEALGDLCC